MQKVLWVLILSVAIVSPAIGETLHCYDAIKKNEGGFYEVIAFDENGVASFDKRIGEYHITAWANKQVVSYIDIADESTLVSAHTRAPKEIESVPALSVDLSQGSEGVGFIGGSKLLSVKCKIVAD